MIDREDFDKMPVYDRADWACSRLKQISRYMSKNEFSIRDISYLEPYMRQVNDIADSLNTQIKELISSVRKAEWAVFIEHLPIVESISADSVIVKGDTYSRCGDYSIYGNNAVIYHCEGNNIYVFENDHYYDESRWGSPDQIDRERMGFGKNTIYKEENGRIIAISSGSTNFAALYRDVTENFTKKYHAVDDETMKKYEVPILKFPDEPPKE